MPRKLSFDSRKLMELAIEVMQQSVQEPRKDNKANPKVGTVLFKPDGTVEKACRGELRSGDHSEYTLLERKNQSTKLDRSILFTTLEPCAPASRHDPKMSCAERIVLARIKEVWVGIEDPDPTVDRKGIRYLQDSGVTVHMFDRDLQEVIKEENRDFIAQAMERAAAVKAEKPKKITLSSLENEIPATALEDFSTVALKQFQTIAKITDKIGSSVFNRRLVQQGLLTEKAGQFTATGYGLLLFGKEPRNAMPQAGLLATIHYPDGKEEPKDFDGPMVLIPGFAERWLSNKLPNVIDRSSMRRKEVPPVPFEMVREAIVNALIHRDYDIRQAKCQLIVTSDTIAVKSPGGPLPPITLEQLQAFSAPMLSRNPELHYVFARMELAEERGLGIKSLKNRAEQVGLPLPSYDWTDPYVVLTLYRTPESAMRTLAKDVVEKLNADEKSAWQFVVRKEVVTSGELIEQLRVDERKAQRILKKMVEVGILRRDGKGPATRYKIIRS
jgi:ATP-dependent DNA helicase RecG